MTKLTLGAAVPKADNTGLALGRQVAVDIDVAAILTSRTDPRSSS